MASELKVVDKNKILMEIFYWYFYTLHISRHTDGPLGYFVYINAFDRNKHNNFFKPNRNYNDNIKIYVNFFTLKNHCEISKQKSFRNAI